ncbi:MULTISPECIES: ATP-binding cassette domain-containing protein [Methylobacterium]|jgi:sulfonate transport system ATP-binding protein|uniref:ABC transporter ATP-binding protein n=1 Tax=Methylobacterium TaxID=407 RepID=UPI0008EF3D44|nr:MULTISPECIES: ATP-binding cassette domain-containing protein [Methylobacterium]MBZ6414376.1 ATP-binding cassette domain-containing protein [Methylobacterium sp.]MBK3398771.1 ATP-binding cassette domain-containing protein [Methylobacterium ajmalii]MBK3409501.1 ATP-binding cassette domain-containing protein [Methylobacterium ajmalii]MBK3423882.1 ATP-binding cassette domain-containing protein [Methylobacterium ajmalii]SFE14100.1 sulfonate transport system ATP-binding protein [Methylobacterium 
MFASTLRRFEGAPAAPARLRREAIDREIARDRAAPGLGLTLRGLSKSFDGGKPVIDGLDLHIPAGQFVAVVGRSGCGKSTLLRLILGLEAPSAGRVAVEGEGTPRPDAPRRIMFQEPRLLPWASVLDNVAVGLRGGTAAERRARAASALTEVGLAEKAEQWPATLSGGQRQRVALARALVSRPGMLALDEPLGALDALTRIDMQAMIERIWRAQGFTALLVTHDVAEAVALADRILVVESGRIALDVAVPVPRPRRRGDPELAALEGRILDHLLDGRG